MATILSIGKNKDGKPAFTYQVIKDGKPRTKEAVIIDKFTDHEGVVHELTPTDKSDQAKVLQHILAIARWRIHQSHEATERVKNMTPREREEWKASVRAGILRREALMSEKDMEERRLRTAQATRQDRIAKGMPVKDLT